MTKITSEREDKKERLAILKARIKQNTERKTRAMLGTTQRVLVEKVSDRDQDYMVGSAENTRQVLLPRNDALIGKFVDVVIDQIMSINTVRGHEIVWME